MNILILNWRDPKNSKAGGAELVTLEHAKAWVQAGHSVVWFSSQVQNAVRTEFIDGIEIQRWGWSVFGVQICAFFWYLFSGRKFAIVVDQIHGLPFFTPLYVKVKKLVFIHEVAKEVWQLNPWPKPFNLIPAVIGSAAEPLIFKLLYRDIPFWTVSDSTRVDLIAWGVPADTITVIHNGIRPFERHMITKKAKKNIAMYLGAIAVDKGIHDAIRAFAAINSIDETWEFWVVGHGHKKEISRLQELCRSLGIEEKTTFWGFVSEQEKNSLLSKAHVLLHPSVREGWGLVVLEAASLGTPAVVFDVPGLRDSVKNGVTGIVLSKNTPEEMAEQTIDLVRNKKLYEKMQKNAVEWAESLTWEKSTEQSLDLLEKIYGKK